MIASDRAKAAAAVLRRWVPAWWRGEAAGWSRALHVPLWPIEGVYRGVVGARNALYSGGVLRSVASPLPTISIGNIAVGGTGKTPVCAWLAGRLRDAGHNPAIVLRGYGDDEIALHAELNPGLEVVVGVRRSEAASDAARRGCDCIVLDDGFQHRRLQRDLDIVLIAAERWTGRRRLLPRGPWREPLRALTRANHLLITRKTASREAADRVIDGLRNLGYSQPIGIVRLDSGNLVPLGGVDRARPLPALHDLRVVAITTLADPEPFLTQLRAAGAAVEPMTFADHHDFSDREIDAIIGRLDSSTVVMTRKEAVKLRKRLPADRPVYVLEQTVTLEVGEDEIVAAALRAVVGRRGVSA